MLKRSVERVSCFEKSIRAIDSSNRNRLGSTNCLSRSLSSLTLILVAATPACVTRCQFGYHHVFLSQVKSHLHDHRNHRRLVELLISLDQMGEDARARETYYSLHGCYHLRNGCILHGHGNRHRFRANWHCWMLGRHE